MMDRQQIQFRWNEIVNAIDAAESPHWSWARKMLHRRWRSIASPALGLLVTWIAALALLPLRGAGVAVTSSVCHRRKELATLARLWGVVAFFSDLDLREVGPQTSIVRSTSYLLRHGAGICRLHFRSALPAHQPLARPQLEDRGLSTVHAFRC